MTSHIGELWWHPHHDRLAEFLTEEPETRIQYIKENKPSAEVPTRLKWFTPVRNQRGPEWKAYSKAWRACQKARKAYDEAAKAYVEAWKAYLEARKASDEAWPASDEAWGFYDEAWKVWVKAEKAFVEAVDLEALHKVEHPGCPWNGKTLFPEVEA